MSWDSPTNKKIRELTARILEAESDADFVELQLWLQELIDNGEFRPERGRVAMQHLNACSPGSLVRERANRLPDMFLSIVCPTRRERLWEYVQAEVEADEAEREPWEDE